MRPLRLNMQAFGPFGSMEGIDFRAAHDARLFGIYGATGAGKTSILDAICFALFGESSGEERQGEDLRSHHASPDLQTEVRLVFEVGQRRYHIVRRPKQVVRALRGGGVTERPHWAALYHVDKMEISEITGENPGSVIEERKVEAVADRLREILGYTARQFRQVVLLPQGRFRQLLTARSDERSEVLRGLFDVSLYERLVDRLKADAQELRNKIEQSRAVMSARFEAHSVQNMEELLARLSESAEALTNLDAARAVARAARDSARASLESGRVMASAFQELDEALRTRELHILRAMEFQKLKARRTMAERAKACMVHEERLLEAQSGLALAVASASTRRAAFLEAQEHFDISTEVLAASSAAEPLRESLSARIGTLKDYRGRLEAAEPLHNMAAEVSQALAVARRSLEASQGEFEVADQTTRQLHAALSAAEKREAARAIAVRRLEQVQAEAVATNAHTAAAATTGALVKQCADAAAVHAEARAALDQALAEELALEIKLSQAQASHLAMTLRTGEACPVCGSTGHPAPAQQTDEDVVTHDAFVRARASRVAADARERTAAAAIAGLKGELTAAERSLAGVPVPVRAEALIAEEISSLEAALATEDQEVAAAAAAVEAALSNQAVAELTLATARQVFADADKAAAAGVAALAAALSDLPTELREPEVLAGAIVEASDRYFELVGAHSAAQAAERSADQQVRAAQGELDHADAAVIRLTAEVETRKSAFAAALDGNGLSEIQFAASRDDIVELASIEEKIATYDRDGLVGEARIATARRAIGEAARPDLDNLDISSTASELALTEAERKHTFAEQDELALKKTLEDLHAQSINKRMLEAKFAVAGEMSSLTEGRNSLNIRLRDFAIATTFDAVLEAANQRFDRMSGGRFRLLRKVEGSDRRTRSGLDIEVLDAHTDQKRDAHTLSGGEGFLASLSLALGLSDVVQAEAGGVKLDAIFIDEGFGHLDDETLDLALDTLRDLVGHERTVGVISHVEAVKQQIPNGFEVERGIRGSHVVERRTA